MEIRKRGRRMMIGNKEERKKSLPSIIHEGYEVEEAGRENCRDDHVKSISVEGTRKEVKRQIFSVPTIQGPCIFVVKKEQIINMKKV